MQTEKQPLELVLLVISSVLLIIVLAVWCLSDSQLNRSYRVDLEAIEVPEGDSFVAEGERLAMVRGCFWCHGQNLEGQQYFADAGRGVIVVASNLTRKIREYSAADFARAVRHGVKPDGTSLQPAMPSFAFYNMSDADMAAIMAYINSIPEQEGLPGDFKLLPVGWFRWVAGKLPANVADLIDHDAIRPDPGLNGDMVLRGRYLAESICTECHGDNGRIRVPNTPDLQIAAAYGRDDFERLIRTGVPLGERNIDYHMVDASKYRYTRLTSDEVEALYSYFRSFLE